MYDAIGSGSCVDANGRVFERFQKSGLTATECSNFCTQEPKCGGYYHLSFGSGFCNVLGPGLAQPTGWGTVPSEGGVWPIAKVGVTGVGATCYRKIATTTGNNR